MDILHPETFRFNEFRIDTRAFQVSLNGAAVSLEPRVYDLVIHLIRRRDRVVTKDELLETVWMQEQLSESVIARAVCIARKAFSDPKCIQTVYRRGYRWMTPVTIERNGPIAEQKATSPELHVCERSWPSETCGPPP